MADTNEKDKVLTLLKGATAIRDWTRSHFSLIGHKHTKSEITDFPDAIKNPTSLKVQFQGGTTEGTNLFTYDGSVAKTVNITKASIGLGNAENTKDIDKNVNSAKTLTTARTIALSGAAIGTATSFNGSKDITIPVTSLDASKLTGTASVPTTGNAASATKLQTARSLWGQTFDGTKDISGNLTGVGSVSASGEIVTSSATGLRLKQGSYGLLLRNDGASSYFLLTKADDAGGSWNDLRPFTINNSTGQVSFGNGLSGELTGNASTATTLKNTRTIALSGGATGTATEFNGSKNITIPVTSLDGSKLTGTASIPTTGNAGSATKLQNARTLTIGRTGKSFNGTANVSWTLNEIGAVGVYDRTNIGTSPKYDDPGVNGLFELRGASEVTGQTGTRPFDGYGPFFSVKTPDNIAMMQIAGTGSSWYIRGKQSASVTMKDTAWNRLVVNSGTWGISTTGNAATATKLQTARNINGTSFNGSGDITTAKWGTARSVYISDSDGTNTGTEVSVDGAANATLKLPATIKGTLTGNASTASKLQNARTIAISGGATGTATSFDGSAGITIPVTSLDATKLTGQVPIASIPPKALERMVIVADDTARFKLTSAQVQVGDVVKVVSSKIVYYVKDETKLSSADGYEEFAAGKASSVEWSDVLNKPSTFAPSSHTHTKSQITDFPTSLKNPTTLKIQLNGGTTEGTNQFSYDGSAAKNINVAPSTIGALPTAGGTMTGDISYQGTKASYKMIKWIDNTADTYGNGVAIGGGGAVIVGGGESSDSVKSVLSSGGDEKLILANDGAIDIYTNVQNGVDKATHVTIDTNGKYSGTAVGADKLTTARKIELTGDATGFATFDGSANIQIKTLINNFTGASADAAGKSGLVPAPSKGTQDYYLSAAGTWSSISGAVVNTKVNNAAYADKAGILSSLHKFTIGNSTKQFNGSQDVSWTLKEIGVEDALKAYEKRDAWNAVTQGQKWSRILYVDATNNVEGVSGILSITCTRGSVVCNYTFAVNASHSQNCSIVQLNSTNYSTIRIRGVVDSSGNLYVELYDTANSIVSGTTQTWHCVWLQLAAGTVTTYTAFTDGSTLPSGFVAKCDFTTTAGRAIVADTFKGALSGNASTATTLQTARTINGTSFNGSASITTANWGTARNIYIQDSDGTNKSAAVSVNGSADATLKLPATIKASLTGHASSDLALSGGTMTGDITFTATGTTGTSKKIIFSGSTDGAQIYYNVPTSDQGNLVLNMIDDANAYIQFAKGGTVGSYISPADGIYHGKATSADKLATSHTINGTSFDGSGNITTANWGTARTIKIGSTGKSVNGSGDVTWTLAEIGAAASSHTHDDRYFTETEINTFAYKDNRGDSVNATTDFNTLTSAGSYKVQMSAWGNADTYHSPNKLDSSIYSFGILFVAKSSNSDSEHRIIQIYMPHGKGANSWAMRWHNGDNVATASQWSSWTWVSTNTWRGIQNSLTSTSTTDSLSAAQGKALNDKFGSYLPLSGGTMTGQIQKAGVSTSWVTGRSNAMIRQNSYTGYNPIISAKTTNGSWELGPYTSDILHLSYITDTNFNAGTNAQTADIQFKTDGSITAKSFVGNASTATTLQTSRKINGTAFNGSADITTANWGTARTIKIGSTGKSVNGSADVTWTLAEIGAAASSHTHNYAASPSAGGGATYGYVPRVTKTANTIYGTNQFRVEEFSNGTSYNLPSNHWYHIFSTEGSDNNYETQLALGMTTSAVYYRTRNGSTTTWPSWSQLAFTSSSISGNAATSTKLQTARKINGTSFNGSADITTANWGTARTVKIGNTGKSVNGSADVTWTLSEIGAAAASHTHNYAGSSSAGGSANTAETLKKVTVEGGNTNNYPFHRFAYVTNVTGQYSDTDCIFLIRQRYDGGYYGIVKVSMRTNSTNNAVSVSANWLVRRGWAVDAVQFGRWGVTGNACYADIFLKTPGTYPRTEVVRLSSSSNTWTLCDSNEVNSTTTSDRKTSTNCYSSISDAATQLHSGTAYTATGSSTDAGTVSSANQLTTGRTIQTNLGSTSAASFNGTVNVTPGITGTLAVAHGGTGATTFTSGAALVGNGTNAVTTLAIAEAKTGSTLVKRTSNGYINATYFNQSSGAESPSSGSYWIYANSDGYFRKSTNQNAARQLIKKAAITLSASSWSGTAAPYTYDLGSTYAGGSCTVGFNSSTGTVAQLAAAQKANIQGSNDTKLYAYGTKPTVDIPIIVEYT